MRKIILLGLLLVLLSVSAPARADDSALYYYALPSSYSGYVAKFTPGGYFAFGGSTGMGMVLDTFPRNFANVALFWRGACVNIPEQFDGWLRLGRDTAGVFQVDFYLNGSMVDWKQFTAVPGAVDQIFRFDVRKPWDTIMLIFGGTPRYIKVLGAWGARR